MFRSVQVSWACCMGLVKIRAKTAFGRIGANCLAGARPVVRHRNVSDAGMLSAQAPRGLTMAYATTLRSPLT